MLTTEQRDGILAKVMVKHLRETGENGLKQTDVQKAVKEAGGGQEDVVSIMAKGFEISCSLSGVDVDMEEI